MPAHFIILESTNVNTSGELRVRAPGFFTLAGHYVVFKFSNINGAIAIAIGALPVLFVVLKIAHI